MKISFLIVTFQRPAELNGPGKAFIFGLRRHSKQGCAIVLCRSKSRFSCFLRSNLKTDPVPAHRPTARSAARGRLWLRTAFLRPLRIRRDPDGGTHVTLESGETVLRLTVPARDIVADAQPERPSTPPSGLRFTIQSGTASHSFH